MVTVIVRFFQLLRYSRDRFDWVIQNPKLDFNFSELNHTVTNLSSDHLTNTLYNLAQLTDTYEMMDIQIKYSKTTFRQLEDMYK